MHEWIACGGCMGGRNQLAPSGRASLCVIRRKNVEVVFIQKTLNKRKNAHSFLLDFLSYKIAGGIAPEERARFGS